MGRVLIILGSLLIIAIAAASPATAKTPDRTEAAAMCLLAGSICSTGWECCSEKCRLADGTARCDGSDPPPTH